MNCELLGGKRCSSTAYKLALRKYFQGSAVLVVRVNTGICSGLMRTFPIKHLSVAFPIQQQSVA